MKPSRFDYLAPSSLDESVALLAHHGPDAKPLAGGQSLVPLMNLRLAAPSVLVDLARIPGLDAIEERDGELAVGALVRHATVASSSHVRRLCPLLSDAVALVGYPSIRVRGTLGGSIAHADPAAELPLAALTLDARLRLVGPLGSRWVDAGDFFRGYFTTALEADELLVEVRFQSAEPGERWAFEEFNRKSGDFAVAAVAVTLGLAGDAIDRVRVGVAGGGDRPLRAPRTEAELAGTPLADLDAAAMGDAVADEVVPDGEREAAERRTLLAVLVRRALDRAANPERSRT